jgi:predicted SprT family Zn-dependent metalloprotease
MAGSDKKDSLKKKYSTSPEKRDAKKAFDQAKEKLAQDFLHELDERITTCQLSELTAATGGLRIKWSNSLQTTAGRAHWKCKEITTMVQQPDGVFKSTKERRHEAWIELATKVLNNEDDLLNTVAHEFCHLAVFMLNGKPKFAHGTEFKSWGQKCMDAFASRGIEVTTKHNYEIIWRCADCTCEVKRHSKSVDPVKQKCGRCRGTLEQVKPVPRAAGKGKGKSAYQEFVSKEMKVLKAEGRALSFKDMMGIVSTRWKAQQQVNRDDSSEKGLQGLENELGELAVTDLVSD